MTRTKHARSTTGRKLAAGALSVPMALTMAGTAAATEPVAAETVVVASTADELLVHDALAAKPAEKADKPVEAKKAEKADKVEEVEESPAQAPDERALPTNSNSKADLSLAVACSASGATVTVTSDKDISNVKVYYDDGSKVERSLSGNDYSEFFAGQVVKVTAKSGTTSVVEDGLTCAASAGGSGPSTPTVPVTGTPPVNGGGGAGNNNGGPNSTADLDLDVQCVEDGVTVVVGSDKDISNVKVFYADGSTDEVQLDGLEYEETFTGDIVMVTAKSGTTEVEVLVEDFAACVVNPGSGGENPAGENPAGENPAGENPAGENPAGENPAGENPVGENPAGENPVGPETPGTAVDGVETDAGTGTPPVVNPPANGGGTVVETPVVNTPVVPVLPINAQPAPSAGRGVAITGSPAQQAFAPTRGIGLATASPSALPFTGSTTSLLLALGAGLVVVGGGLALSGRRETVAPIA